MTQWDRHLSCLRQHLSWVGFCEKSSLRWRWARKVFIRYALGTTCYGWQGGSRVGQWEKGLGQAHVELWSWDCLRLGPVVMGSWALCPASWSILDKGCL